MVPLLEEAVQAPRTQRSVEVEGQDEVKARSSRWGMDWDFRGRGSGGGGGER